MLKKILVALRGQKKPVAPAVPRDGDGDGKINDGKPTEAPAPAPVKKPAAKKAPAKKAPAAKKSPAPKKK